MTWWNQHREYPSENYQYFLLARIGQRGCYKPLNFLPTVYVKNEMIDEQLIIYIKAVNRNKAANPNRFS